MTGICHFWQTTLNLAKIKQHVHWSILSSSMLYTDEIQLNSANVIQNWVRIYVTMFATSEVAFDFRGNFDLQKY